MLPWQFGPVRQGLAATCETTSVRVEIIALKILDAYSNRGGSATLLPMLAKTRTQPCLMTATSAVIVQAYHGHALITLRRYDEAARVGRAALEIAGSTSQWLPRFSGLLLLGCALTPSEPDSAVEHLGRH